jgi:hypothetical protein
MNEDAAASIVHRMMRQVEEDANPNSAPRCDGCGRRVELARTSAVGRTAEPRRCTTAGIVALRPQLNSWETARDEAMAMETVYTTRQQILELRDKTDTPDQPGSLFRGQRNW